MAPIASSPFWLNPVAFLPCRMLVPLDRRRFSKIAGPWHTAPTTPPFS